MTKKEFVEAIQKDLLDHPNENGGVVLANFVADALKPKDRERLLKEIGIEWGVKSETQSEMKSIVMSFGTP